MRRVLKTLNRRLDACFEDMDATWAIYEKTRKPDDLDYYMTKLRRANRLWALIKTIPNS